MPLTLEDVQIVAKLAIRIWKSHTIEELAREFYDYISKEKGMAEETGDGLPDSHLYPRTQKAMKTDNTKETQMITTRQQAIDTGLSFPDTYQDAPFHDDNWQLIRYKWNEKAFLWTYLRNGYVCLNVKASPDRLYFWRDRYESVVPGYHQNKEHWNTIILDGSIPDEDIRAMIAESYEAVSDSPTRRIYEAVKQIPRGFVATYSQVAEAAGDAKMARAVGNALHRNPDPAQIPCNRVVNARGELAARYAFGGEKKQEERLRAEGVEVKDGRVDLSRFGWKK